LVQQPASVHPVFILQRATQDASQESSDSSTVPGVRITSQPMNTLAAEAEALFAEQTDSQLTQGSATAIHSVPNIPPASLSALPDSKSQYTMAQYTPSAQEAATGAYSVPKQPAAQQQPPAQKPPPHAKKPSPRQQPGLKQTKHAKKKNKPTPTLGEQTAPTPTLDHVPAEQESPQQVQAPVEVPAEPEPATGAGLTDQELMQRNLPPLRGPWIRIQRDTQPLSPREEAEMQLRSIESGYSGWLGAAGIVNYRVGNPGYDQLANLEAPFEASAPLGYNARVALIVKPVFLDSGQANGNAVLTVQGSGTPGVPLTLIAIPEPIGSMIPITTTPAQQNAAGLAAVDLPASGAGRRIHALRFSGGHIHRSCAVETGKRPVHFQFQPRLDQGFAAFLRRTARPRREHSRQSRADMGRRDCQLGQFPNRQRQRRVGNLHGRRRPVHYRL
jgi:hypothetical protein